MMSLLEQSFIVVRFIDFFFVVVVVLCTFFLTAFINVDITFILLQIIAN